MAADRAQTALAAMLALIEDDLAALGIRHDVFFSERSLTEGPRNEVGRAIASSRRKDLVYTGSAAAAQGQGR